MKPADKNRLRTAFQDALTNTPALMEAFKKAGSLGGRTRAKQLTAEQRREIGRRAAAARWKGHKAKSRTSKPHPR